MGKFNLPREIIFNIHITKIIGTDAALLLGLLFEIYVLNSDEFIDEVWMPITQKHITHWFNWGKDKQIKILKILKDHNFITTKLMGNSPPKRYIKVNAEKINKEFYLHI